MKVSTNVKVKPENQWHPGEAAVPEATATQADKAIAAFEKAMKGKGPVRSPFNKMREMTDKERKVLKLSIKESGLFQGVTLDTQGRVFDGYHRSQIMHELFQEGHLSQPMGAECVDKVVSPKAQDAKIYEFGLNAARRHLSAGDMMEQAIDAGLIQKRASGSKSETVNLRAIVEKQFNINKTAAANVIKDAREAVGLEVGPGHRYTEAEARKIVRGVEKIMKTRKDARSKGEAVTASQKQAKERNVRAAAKRVPMATPSVTLMDLINFIKDASATDLTKIERACKHRRADLK